MLLELLNKLECHDGSITLNMELEGYKCNEELVIDTALLYSSNRLIMYCEGDTEKDFTIKSVSVDNNGEWKLLLPCGEAYINFI